MGHELNPRIGPLDMKLLNFRMSFLTWLMMDMCLVLKASQDDGGISPSMAIVTIFQVIYIADVLWFEVSSVYVFVLNQFLQGWNYFNCIV